MHFVLCCFLLLASLDVFEALICQHRYQSVSCSFRSSPNSTEIYFPSDLVRSVLKVRNTTIEGAILSLLVIESSFLVINMALKKASKPVFRFLSAECNVRRTFFRPLTSPVDQGVQRDCLQQSESPKTHGGSNSGTYMRWASVLVLSAGLGLLQLPELKSDFSNSNEEEKRTEGRKNRFILRDSYRRRLFFNYERRIRMRSSPEKVFEYFASFRTPDGELFMTPADLVRAVVPVFPPPDSNIVRGGSLRGEQSPGELHCPQSELFMRFDTNGDGLISFPEYIFFVTLLSIPESDILATVKMFDLDRNGEIKKEEFKKVMRLLRDNNRQGSAQRDGFRTGLKVGDSVDNGGLVEYFFGKDGKGRLQITNFSEFVRALHKEITRLEFLHYDHQECGTISARDFALSLVAAADVTRVNQYLNQVDDLSKDPSLSNIHITREEFESFAELRKKLQPLSLAISSYGQVYGLLTPPDFQRAASHVCDVDITDRMVKIIFYIFDTNKDGRLSTDEFLAVLERRERDIAYPADSGISNLLTCWWKCAKDCHSARI